MNRTFGDWIFTTGLENLDAQLLVVHGARDSAAVPPQCAWADAVRDGRLLLIPDTGKGAVAECPEIVLPPIASFLGGAWPAEETPRAR